jgi:hypothetical protein
MNFSERTEKTARDVFAALDVTPTDAQRRAVARLIEQQLVDTAVDTRRWCADHAVERSRIGRKAGRLFAEELSVAHDALIANLSSLR